MWIHHKIDVAETDIESIIPDGFTEFKQEYAGTPVVRLFVVTLIVITLISFGAAGMVRVIITTGLVGLETEIARVGDFVAGILAAILYMWVTGPITWRIWEYWFYVERS